MFAQNNDCYLIHSASVEYNGCAWLFSGKSGEGKSTHTKLWNKYYGSALINGDLNMVGFENEEAVVYGIPWCGTSEIYTEKKYKLGGIIFINAVCERFGLRKHRPIKASLCLCRELYRLRGQGSYLKKQQILQKS